MKPFFQLFENTADAAVGIDGSQRIRFWNSASERFFGLSSEEVKNRSCHSIVGGTDLNGDVFCSPDCLLFKRLLKGDLVSDYDLVVRGSGGESVVANVGAVLVPEARRTKKQPLAFLLFRRVDSYRLIKRLAAEPCLQGDGSRLSKYQLSAREMEILNLASTGERTPGIADRLSISETTVRNHFKKIFSKLGVHSRTEAISLALRSNFF
jgi:PAS domain S-box-containing protein